MYTVSIYGSIRNTHDYVFVVENASQRVQDTENNNNKIVSSFLLYNRCAVDRGRDGGRHSGDFVTYDRVGWGLCNSRGAKREHPVRTQPRRRRLQIKNVREERLPPSVVSE